MLRITCLATAALAACQTTTTPPVQIVSDGVVITPDGEERVVVVNTGDAHREAVRGSGTPGERVLPLESVRGVEVTGSIPVHITASGEPTARIDCDDNLLDHIYLTPFVNDGGGESVRVHHDNIDPQAACSVTLAVPALTSVTLSGSSDIDVADVSSTLTGILQGSGTLTATGTSSRTEWVLMGSGDIDGTALQSEWLSASVIGSGDIRARASRHAELSVLGSGDIHFQGAATTAENITGSGRIHRSE